MGISRFIFARSLWMKVEINFPTSLVKCLSLFTSFSSPTSLRGSSVMFVRFGGVVIGSQNKRQLTTRVGGEAGLGQGNLVLSSFLFSAGERSSKYSLSWLTEYFPQRLSQDWNVSFGMNFDCCKFCLFAECSTKCQLNTFSKQTSFFTLRKKETPVLYWFSIFLPTQTGATEFDDNEIDF